MSMFREHWIGGLVAYSTFFVASVIATIAISIIYTVPMAWNPTISLNPIKIVGCFTVAVPLRIVARCRYQEQEPKDILYAPVYPECCANRFFPKVFGISVARSICNAPDYE